MRIRRKDVYGVIALILLLGANIGWPYIPPLWRSLTSAPQPSWHTPFDVAGFKLWRSDVPSPEKKNLYWVGSDKLLFSGVPGEPISDKKSMTIPHSRLHIWELGKKPEVIARQEWQAEKDGRSYCGDESGIFYSIAIGRSKIDWFVYNQSTGNSKSVAIYTNKQQDGAFSLGDNLSCVSGYLTDPRMKQRAWGADTTGRYYLDFGALEHVQNHLDSGDEYFRLIDTVDWKVFSTRFSQDSIKNLRVKFFLGTGNFLLVGRHSSDLSEQQNNWKRSNCFSFWLLNPASRVTKKYCVPYGEWSEKIGSIMFLDTKVGPFFYYYSEKSALYFLNGGHPKKIIDGWLYNAAVSPNGCKVAFIVEPLRSKSYQKFKKSVYVLDVCG